MRIFNNTVKIFVPVVSRDSRKDDETLITSTFIASVNMQFHRSRLSSRARNELFMVAVLVNISHLSSHRAATTGVELQKPLKGNPEKPIMAMEVRK